MLSCNAVTAAWCFPAAQVAPAPGTYCITPAATLIDRAIRLALKKKDTMQCTVPTGRIVDE